jgi:hypothetical protein
MTQATPIITTAADAIIALINSRPWTPSRDEIIQVLETSEHAVRNQRPDYDNAPTAPLRMRPTELGWQMIEKLMPAFADRVRFSGHLSYKDPRAVLFEAWTQEAQEALWDAKHSATHLADIAIAYRIALDDEYSDEDLQTILDGGDVPTIDGREAMAYRLVSRILAMAGVDERRCSYAEYYKSRGLKRESVGTVDPTPAEWKDAELRARKETSEAAMAAEQEREDERDDENVDA